MKQLITTLFNPETAIARWLIALFVIGLFSAGALGYLEPARQLLTSDQLTFKFGSFSLTLYKLLKGIFILIILFWFANIFSNFCEKKLKKLKKIKPSNRELLIKGFHVTLYFIVFLLVLEIFGIDFTTLAVIGGAIGIGIGFGLQKITSNFISGLILLFEKSIEEGDLVELNDGTYGFIRKTSARYTLVETLDNKEILIPNEDFITNRVTNWTYSSNLGRIEIPIGVSYDSDIEKARELILTAANEHPRSSKNPLPKCHLREFSDSSVNFILHFWLDDVTKGIYEPHSDVMRSIWKKFKTHNITIPFPQRDLHIKNPEALKQ